MKRQSKLIAFILRRYWRFVAFSIVTYPVFFLIVVCVALKDALKEFIDTDFTLQMDRKTYARLRKNYGVDKK